MPWEKREPVSERKRFIALYKENKFNISELCRQFGISRPTAYKWIAREAEDPLNGCEDRSRRPHCSPNRTRPEVEDVILAARDKNPAWGGRKLREVLINDGTQDVPSEPTINRVLKRHRRVSPEASKSSQKYTRFEREEPNELWQMDFKGHFAMQSGRCHPLTVLDDCSRFSICLKACDGETEVNVRAALTDAFRTYGLPVAMTMDNGSPWKGGPNYRLSRLTVWLARLGIKVSHSRPYHPQTQGKDERFHRTLKEEVLKYSQFKGLPDAQDGFDRWREVYNFVRPHEALGLKRPGDRYTHSSRPFPERLPDIEYEESDILRKVQRNGTISWEGREIFVGEHLYREHVALRPSYRNAELDVFYCRTRVMTFRGELKSK